ncbi:DUF4383 domain-containing protein [Amnibacterium flavum]|uniref:DUF4383 domain-containing protein n=1 Tax=Amnibacterium flavum TaxID=2173173 RepID=A0A2V1HSY4_9MICO|nr:DUF4383 domain-containing protein [Amnibacterium flavum]PVZ95441.1 DUF4383 domain-containing protein [Amnibacterium flavum]
MSTATIPLSKSPNRLIGTIFGAVYLLVGLLGFAVTGGVDFIAPDGGLLLGIFEVNPLHNVAHLLIGAALLIAGLSSVPAAKTVNGIVGAAYLLLGIVGFFLAADPSSPVNFLALNTADHFLHLGSAVILGGVAIGADKVIRGSSVTA